MKKLSKWIVALVFVFGFSFSQLFSVAFADDDVSGNNLPTVATNDITLSSTHVKPGDSIKITIKDPSHNANGDRNTLDVSYESDAWNTANKGSNSVSNSNASGYAYLQYDSQDQAYEGYLNIGDSYDGDGGVPTVPTNVINGNWTLTDLDGSYDDNLPSSSFNVSGGQDDVVAPEVSDISLYPQGAVSDTVQNGALAVNAGDQVTVVVNATDNANGSGIDSEQSYVTIGTGDQGENSYNLQVIHLNPILGTTKYQGSFTVPKAIDLSKSYGGKYYITNYYLVDKAGNHEYEQYNAKDSRFINNDSKSLIINNGVSDITAPTVTAVTTDQDGQTVETGHKIHVAVTASDDKSGINNREGNFTALFTSDTARGGSDGDGGVGPDNQNVNLTYNSSTQKYEGDFTVPLDATLGLWRLESISLQDNAGNYQSYDYYSGNATDVALLLAHKFTIVKDVTAPSAPRLNAVNDSALSVSGTAEAGSTVTIGNGKMTWNVVADNNGSFSVTVPAQAEGTILTATAKDAAGNISGASSVTVTKTPIPVLFTAYLTKGHAVRTAATASARKLGSLPKGAAIQVIGTDGQWDKILYNNQVAYVYGETAQIQPVLYTAYLTKGHAIRTGASSASGKITTLKAGSAVSVLTSGEWTTIRYNGTTAYVYGKDLARALYSGKTLKQTLLKSKASAKSKTVKKLKKNTTLIVLHKGKKWDTVVYAGHLGYALKTAVKKK
ncbi:MAG: Ig-like domain-containing protein [Sporolactobacillus sp.]